MSKVIKRKFSADQFKLNVRVQDNSVDTETRTAKVTWSKGTKGLRRSFWGEYYEELDLKGANLERLNMGAPVLASHDAYSLDSVIGVVEKAWIENGEGLAMIRFAQDEASDIIFQKVRDGILTNISVGYDVSEYEDVTGPDEEIPTFRAKTWEPMEISIVPIGFDKFAQVRNQETNKTKDIKIVDKRQVTIGEINMPPEIKETQETKLPESTVDTTQIDKAVEAERVRCLEIRKIVKAAGLDESLGEDYISQNQTLEFVRTNVALFAKYAQKQTDTRISGTVEVGAEDIEKKREGFEAALMHRVDSSNFKVTDASRAFIGKSLLRQLEQYIGRRPMETDFQFAKRAMTSSDLPLILANVAEKSAQERYKLMPRTWQAWAGTGTLRNFKEASQVRAGDVGNLEKRSEKGEYQYSSIGEENETAKLEQYGVKHAFSDVMLVNDDLSLITKVASETGVAVSRLENRLAYEALRSNPLMADGFAVFSTEHGNLGTPGAISETTFNAAFQAMRTQKSVDERDYLNIAPKFFIVGPQLETEAKKFLATVTPNQNSQVNIFSNSLQLIVDAEISNDEYYFAASPSEIDTVKVFRLEGQESAKVDSRINWDNDSIELKIAHAVSAKAMDYRGLFKNKKT